MGDMTDTRDCIPTPTELLPSQCAWRCQLTPALLLRGFSVSIGGIPARGLDTPGFLQNPYPSKPVAADANVQARLEVEKC